MPTLTKEELENQTAGWPTPFKSSFIEPGIVFYDHVGMVLVRKAALDKMANTMKGKPVIDEEHRDAEPSDYDKGSFDGMVDGNDSAVWFDPSDAMFHCSYQVKKSSPAIRHIQNGYKVSCAYKVTEWGPGGIHNNVKYDREVLNGEYTHLAIVSNPRYEGVRIYNEKGASKMKLLWWKTGKDAQGQELQNSVEIESAKSTVVLDGGKEVTLDNCIEAYIAQEKEREEADKLKNSAPKDEDLIDIGGGKKVPFKDLKAAAIRNSMSAEDKQKALDLKNAQDKERADKEALANKLKNEMEEDHKDKKHDKDAVDNCGLCNAVKEFKASAEGKTHFERVDKIANSRPNLSGVDDLPEPYDPIAAGAVAFGSAEPKK